MTTKQSPFLLLPPELRLQIYDYILDIQTPYTTLTQCRNPLIVINDTGNKFTTRSTYRALHISPKWVGISEENKNTLSLLSVNRLIHAEVEHFLYTSHTLFFLNGFDVDCLGDFLDTLSPTARRCIRSIGFEIYLFVHNNPGIAEACSPPKRSFTQYERAAKVLREKLPNLRGVVFYLDPWFSACCDDAVFGPWSNERSVLGKGVGFLVRAFGGVKKMKRGSLVEMDFLPATMRLPGIGTGTASIQDNLVRAR